MQAIYFKIQGTYFKISALYFLRQAMYFSACPFATEKFTQNPLFIPACEKLRGIPFFRMRECAYCVLMRRNTSGKQKFRCDVRTDVQSEYFLANRKGLCHSGKKIPGRRFGSIPVSVACSSDSFT